jgi:hypothetical protein
MAVAIKTGISVSARGVVEHLKGLGLLGAEHDARVQSLLAMASQIDLLQGRMERSKDHQGPTAAMWQAYERMLAPLEALAPARELDDAALPGLDPVSS